MKRIFRPIALVMIFALLCSFMYGCAENDSSSDDNIIISRGFMVESIPQGYTKDGKTETMKDGSRELYYVLDYSEGSEAELEALTKKWSNMPVLTTYSNFYDYANVLPETSFKDMRKTLTSLLSDSSVKYYFSDKTGEFAQAHSDEIKRYLDSIGGKKKTGDTPLQSGYSVSDSDPRLPDYAVGFCCGFYVPSQRRLYYYQFDANNTDENIRRAALA